MLLNLVPLIKIIRGIISRNKWRYFIKILPDCYYLKIQSKENPKAFTLIKVDEMQLGAFFDVEMELPIEFIVFLNDSPIKSNVGSIVKFHGVEISVNDLTFQGIPDKVELLKFKPDYVTHVVSKYILDRVSFIYDNKYFSTLILSGNEFISIDKDKTVCSMFPSWIFFEEAIEVPDMSLFISTFMRFFKKESDKAEIYQDFMMYKLESKALNFTIYHPLYPCDSDVLSPIYEKRWQLEKSEDRFEVDKTKVKEWNDRLTLKGMEQISIKKGALVLDKDKFKASILRCAEYDDEYEKITVKYSARHALITHKLPEHNILVSARAKPENLNLTGIRDILFGETIDAVV